MSKTNASEEIYQYALQNSLKEHPVLTKLRERTATHPRAVMQISPDQGQFMALLAKITNAKRYLEIGVFTGYSSLVMALGMGPGSKVTGLDISDEFVNIAKEYWEMAGVSSQIETIIGNAVESVDTLIQQGLTDSFDIAFIDANKPDYIKYYEACYKLVRKGGLILIDNTFFHGGVLDENPNEQSQAIKEFNQHIYKDERVDISMLTIADGLTIAYKK